MAFILFLSMKRPETKGPEMVRLAHDKGNLPIFQTNFQTQGEMCRKSIGIGFSPVPSVSPDLYRHQMKSVLPTDQAPELFTWWPSYRAEEMIRKNYVADMTALWDKHDADYSPEVREAFTFKGRVYGFPYVVEYWVVWYNKTIFKRLGLSEPSTWDEFTHICESLKGSGVTPVLSSLQNEWPAIIWFEEMIIGEDPDLYKDLCTGKARYTDPRVLKGCMIWKDMIEKGYFTNPSVNMLTNAGYLWNNEKFGMVLCGTWYYMASLVSQGVDPRDIGVFILPSHNPAAGKNVIVELGPLYIAKNAPNARKALKVADWWMGREGNGYFSMLHHSYSGNMQTDTSHLPRSKKKIFSAIKEENYRLLNRFWEATPPEICEKAVLKFGEFILNPELLPDTLKEIDQSAVEYWSQHPDR